MVIFPAHILTVAMRTSSWGTAETEGSGQERGRGGKPGEMFRMMFFRRWGDRRGKKGGKNG